MSRLTQDDLRQEFANRECWGNGQDRPGQGAWMEQLRPAGHEASGAGARLNWLLRTIEAEIIPRLMLAHQTAPFPALDEVPGSMSVGREEVVAFARLALAQPAEAALAHIARRRADGLALEVIYLQLLSPAARHLGELWEADLCDFTQVTLGLWRLQQVMHELSPAFQNEATYDTQRRRALLVPVPGSQHTLGLFMVTEFFRRAGWDVSGEPTSSLPEMVGALRAEWFDVLGLSVGADCHLENLSSIIATLRKASQNRALGVLVGGPTFAANPGLAVAVGADATAPDAPQAIAQAEALVSQRTRRC